MWIQVRTIDGKETRTIEDLSRLTKIECLRLKIKEIFDVNPEHQRLFYRGKQMEDGQTLFDYNVGLNDIVQLLIRSQADPPDSPNPKDYEGVACSSVTPVSTTATTNNGAKSSSPLLDNQPSTSSRSFLIDPGIGAFKINELVDCRDISIGAWFEASMENVSRVSKGQNGKAPVTGQSGKPSKRTSSKQDAEQGLSVTDNNGNVLLNSDRGPSTSLSDSTDTEEIMYHIKYDDYPENGVVEMCSEDVRPRARTVLKWEQLEVGQVIMVNYNIEMPEERGFWYDAEITSLKELSRTNKEVRVKLLLG